MYYADFMLFILLRIITKMINFCFFYVFLLKLWDCFFSPTVLVETKYNEFNFVKMFILPKKNNKNQFYKKILSTIINLNGKGIIFDLVYNMN